jgi:hypothetical protein
VKNKKLPKVASKSVMARVHVHVARLNSKDEDETQQCRYIVAYIVTRNIIATSLQQCFLFTIIISGSSPS